MAKRFRDESEASQVLTETGAKRLKGELPENEGAWEGLAAGKLAAVPLPGQHPYLAAPLRPANSGADAPDQQQSSPPHQQQQQEQQPSPQQSPQQHWQQQQQQQQQQQHPLDEAVLAAAAGSVDWNNPQQVNAFLGWLHHERLRRHGLQAEQQQQQQQQQQAEQQQLGAA